MDLRVFCTSVVKLKADVLGGNRDAELYHRGTEYTEAHRDDLRPQRAFPQLMCINYISSPKYLYCSAIVNKKAD